MDCIVLGLFGHVQVGVFVKAHFHEVGLLGTKLSCLCALDILCDKAEMQYRPMLRIAIAASLCDYDHG